MNTKQLNHTKNMRTFIPFLALTAIMAACGSSSDHSELASLIAKRDSIKSLRSELNGQLIDLESQIERLDTSHVQRITIVTTREAVAGSFEHYFTVQGTVETDQNAQLFPEAPGRVLTIPVKEGDRVQKGTVLMKIDNSIVVQQMQELKARLSLAETVFKKQEKLWSQKVGSEFQYLEAKNNFEALQHNLETLIAQNDMYTITAPFNGVVDEINLKEGEMAAPQMPAFRLVNTDIMYIKSDITERYIGQIKPGDAVVVFFPSIGETYNTTISRLGEFINPDNRTFKMRLELKSDRHTLKPNLLGELKIRDYVNDSTIVIPSSLVQMTPDGQEFVFLIDDNKARKVEITTGMTYDDQVEVLSGLEPGDILIDKGARSIKDGDSVEVSL